MAETCTDTEVELIREVFQRLASDLAMITDRDFSIGEVRTERANARAKGTGGIHISFKLGFQVASSTRHGCLLVPLADAVAIAGYLMMASDEGVKAKRASTSLDGVTKDALLEVGNFVAGAADAALRSLGRGDTKVVPEGCQGVKPDVRPAFLYHEGDFLLHGRARARLHDYPDFELIVSLPDLAV